MTQQKKKLITKPIILLKNPTKNDNSTLILLTIKIKTPKISISQIKI